MAQLRPGQELARVLITVKTYPAPSARHGETVCIAGVRLDGDKPTFIRLYPIPFRMLETSSQFKKYQVVEAIVTPRGSKDPRPESFEPVISSFAPGEVLDTKRKWSARRSVIEPLLDQTTVCELVQKNRAATMADAVQSFALVRPNVLSMEVQEGKPWSPKQLDKVRAATEPTLFRPDGLVELQPVPYRIHFRYRCGEPGCKTHSQELIDWELGAAGLYWPSRYGARTADMIRQQWESMIDTTKKDVHFYVGNQHQRRASFSVCGIWAPPL